MVRHLTGRFLSHSLDFLLQEAEADYAEVRSLLESTGLPFEVTPGGEDCIEAFTKVFGMHSSVRAVQSYNNRKVRVR